MSISSKKMEIHHKAEPDQWLRQFVTLPLKDMMWWMAGYFAGIDMKDRSYEEIMKLIEPKDIGTFNWDAFENMISGDPSRMMGGALWLITWIMSPDIFEELGIPTFAKGIMTEEMLYVHDGMYKLIIPRYIRSISSFYLDPETPLDEIIFLCNTKRLDFFYSFESMENLKEVHILGKIEEIGTHGFDGCESLEKVTFPDTLKRIESVAFAGCVKLRNIKFNEGLEFIGSCAFCND